jgi:hypothetical protein
LFKIAETVFASKAQLFFTKKNASSSSHAKQFDYVQMMVRAYLRTMTEQKENFKPSALTMQESAGERKGIAVRYDVLSSGMSSRLRHENWIHFVLSSCNFSCDL